MFIIKSKISPCWHKQAAGDFRPPVPAPTLTKLPYPNVYLAGPTPLQYRHKKRQIIQPTLWFITNQLGFFVHFVSQQGRKRRNISSLPSPQCPYAYHAMHRLRRVNQWYLFFFKIFNLFLVKRIFMQSFSR